MSSSARAREEAPAPVGAFFACPGGCGRRLPIAAGHLVIEQPASSVNKRGRLVAPAGRPLVAVLCTECTAALVIERNRSDNRRRTE